MIKARGKIILAIAAGMLLSTLWTVLVAQERPDASGPFASSAELVKHAERSYELTAEAWRKGEFLLVDDVYSWSRRWMMAEWDLSVQTNRVGRGAAAHLRRMQQLEETVRKARDAGMAPQRLVAAAAYYREEAELMFKRSGEPAAKE